MSDVDVVTGAFSFTGRYIAEELLDRGRRVRTLTRRPSDEPPLGRDRFDAWLAEHGGRLGRAYTSEVARNFRGYG